VNIAARIAAESAPGEVLVSDVVRGLARTSAGASFEDRGTHELKGVSEPVRLFAVKPVTGTASFRLPLPRLQASILVVPMGKRLRSSYFQRLDEAYHPVDIGWGDGRRTLGGRPPKKFRTEGVIDMTITQFAALAVFFILLACVATAGSAYAVIAIAGEGPRGEQGLQGVQGDPGPQGERGLQGLPGNDASREAVKRMAGLFAVQQASSLQGGAFVSFNDATVGACVQYVLTGQGGAQACPGFQGANQ
jgi:hypothetical protein